MTNLPDTAECAYQWYVGQYDDHDNLEYSSIAKADGVSYEATESGYYACAVFYNDEVSIGYYYVFEEEYDWELEYDDEVEFPYGTSTTLTVKTTYTGAKDDISYQWFVMDRDSGKYIELEDETADSISISGEGIYQCSVTINEQTQDAVIDAYYCTDDYEWVTTYPNATATYTSADPDGLVIDYTDLDDGYPSCNFPSAGDVITVEHDGQTIDFTYDEDENSFVSDEGDELDWSWDRSTDVDIGKGKVRINFYSCTRKYDHPNKKLIIDYDIYTEVDATILTNINSISFKPINSTVYSEDIKYVEDGKTVYDLRERGKYIDPDGDPVTSCFLNGDKLTLVKTNGASSYTYKAAGYHGRFVNDADSTDYIDEYDLSIEDTSLQLGNNTIKVWFRGRSTTFTIFLDSPEQRAQRAAQAAASKAAALAAAQNINKATVTAADIKKASNLGATSVTLGSKVKKISKNAFKGTNIKTVVVKTKKLKATKVKKCLKGSKVSTIKVSVGKKKVNKQYVKKYKKIFTKKNAGKKVKVKAA